MKLWTSYLKPKHIYVRFLMVFKGKYDNPQKVPIDRILEPIQHSITSDIQSSLRFVMHPGTTIYPGMEGPGEIRLFDAGGEIRETNKFYPGEK